MTSSKEFGIYSKDPESLRQYYRISRGIRLLSRSEAESMGYRPIPDDQAEGIAVPILDEQDPISSLQIPTNAEMAAITATSETKRTMRIIRLHKKIASQLLRQCKVNQRVQQELVPGITGSVRSVREDGSNQLNVSQSSIHPGTKVGDHIDSWPNENTSFMIANLGPGERWHRVTPSINRGTESVGTHSRLGIVKYITEHPSPESIAVHWFKLNTPREDYVEAVVNSPVAWALHEGSTLQNNTISRLSSRAVMCIVDDIHESQVNHLSVI